MENFWIPGPRVVLTVPEIKKPSLTLTPELEKEFMENEFKKFDKLEVFAVGQEVPNIEVGDYVTINPIFIRSAERVMIEGKERMVVRHPDITVVWKK